MKKVIDLSKWNVVTDYNLVKQSGVEAAIVKVINSANNPDGRFVEHCNGLRSVGIPIIGGYNYLYANTIAKANAVAPKFIKMCKEQGIKTAWLDIEDACMKNLGSLLTDIINVYIRCAKKEDIYVGIYTGVYFYNAYIKKYESRLEASLPIWFARYPSGTKEYAVNEDIPSTAYLPSNLKIDGWQYTSKCLIPGVKGYVDLSAWWEGTPFVNTNPEIMIQANPFTEPTVTVKSGTMGNDANWVLWYLWRFGKLVDNEGNADSTKIDGMIGEFDSNAIGEVQSILGLVPDRMVGKITRRTWKNIC